MNSGALIKKGIIYSLLFFVLLTVYQMLFINEIHWKDNIGMSLFAFPVYLFFEWAWKPHDYKKNSK